MIHREEILYLPHVSHDSALIAWGAFFFQPLGDGRYELVDDSDLASIADREAGCIGAGTSSYGPATVRITELDAGGAPVDSGRGVSVPEDRSFVRVTGLKPDSIYEYEVFVHGQPWGAAPAEFLSFEDRTGRLAAAEWRYQNIFRTFPAPDGPARSVTFAVIGDPGTGKDVQYLLSRQLLNLVEEEDIRFIVTTGDNIYARTKYGGFLGLVEKVWWKITGKERSSGKEDDDWFASFFLPYRQVINRVPVFPSMGNHDHDETEHEADLPQLVDNYFLEERFPAYAARWRNADGALHTFFYTFRCGPDLEMVCVDTSRPRDDPAFRRPEHKRFIDEIIASPGIRWRIPYGHHPPYSVGPNHGYEIEVQQLANSFTAVDGFRLWLSGHEHNFQHHRLGSLHYVVTGASGKRAEGVDRQLVNPDLTCCHAAKVHFLLVRVTNGTITIRTVGLDGQPVRGSFVGQFPEHSDTVEITADHA